MYVYNDAPGVLGVLYMYICMHYLAKYSAHRSLFGAPIGALGGIDVSQVECVCIMNVCIYLRAGVLGVLYMYVCMHVGMYYVCMYFCTLFSALFGAPIGAPGGIDVSQMGYAYYYECMYASTCQEYWEYYICIYAYMYAYIMYVYMYVCTLFVAPIGALGGIDVSRVDCACIMKVCIYRHAGSTRSTKYVCMHACIMYLCTLLGAIFGAPGGKDV